MPTAAAAATTIHAPDGQAVEYPACLLTVAQLEERHPGVKGRVRGFILRADLNAPDYAGLRDAIIPAIKHAAERLGFIVRPGDARRHIIACPGKPACSSGLIAARALALELARHLPPLIEGAEAARQSVRHDRP